ncbi:MAG: hypothetical protein ACOVP4_07860 [Bacteriovoracaceae bacterium]|jgi:hypothetical protein
MFSKKDLDKTTMYEAVKTLVEEEARHLHLDQQKLFTLFSIAFQYILFRSTKFPGHYIIRIEDSFLAEKLARKAKDESTRKFMNRLMVPRRLVYGNSTFHLDFFNISTWGITKDLPKEKIMAAIVVKNTQQAPMEDEVEFRPEDIFGPNYYLTSLLEFVPKTITIAFDNKFENLTPVQFDFIEDTTERLASGVKISDDVSLEEE